MARPHKILTYGQKSDVWKRTLTFYLIFLLGVAAPLVPELSSLKCKDAQLSLLG